MRYVSFNQKFNGVTREIRFDCSSLRVTHVIGNIDGETSSIVLKNNQVFNVIGTPDEVWDKLYPVSVREDEPGVFDELLEKIKRETSGQKLQVMPSLS